MLRVKWDVKIERKYDVKRKKDDWRFIKIIVTNDKTGSDILVSLSSDGDIGCQNFLHIHVDHFIYSKCIG
jgi:hypothetical protein